MKEIFLGTGANGGTPQIDCRCQNCETATENPSLRRLRSSVLVETSHGKILLDCGPDIRVQLVAQNLKLQDISLIAITHLHPDHAIGLWELGNGIPLETPVLLPSQYLENEKGLIRKFMPGLKYLEAAKYIRFATPEDTEKLGIKFVEVPHDPNFPTNAIVIHRGNTSIWYSPDVADISEQMKEEMKKTDLVIFDATFMNEDILPASKFNHITIEKSAPQLASLNVHAIYSHINHTENPELAQNLLAKFGFSLADDLQIAQT